MAKPIKYLEKMVARFPHGTFTRIDRVLGEFEDRSAFVRMAVENALRLREKKLGINVYRVNRSRLTFLKVRS